jgi:hypothetical protein
LIDISKDNRLTLINSQQELVRGKELLQDAVRESKLQMKEFRANNGRVVDGLRQRLERTVEGKDLEVVNGL